MGNDDEYWKDTPKHIISFAEKQCAENRERMAEEKIRQLELEVEQLKYLLWLNHGCDGLYGDDGEMQCNKCMIDFKRMSSSQIMETWRRANLLALEKSIIKPIKA